MPGSSSGQVLDLLAAADAGRDNFGLRGRGLDGGGELPVAEGHGIIVGLLLDAEGAGHPAAARVALGPPDSCPHEGGDRGRCPHERLLMAVAVEQRTAPAVPEAEVEPPRTLAKQ